jgi:hypothetical protein
MGKPALLRVPVWPLCAGVVLLAAARASATPEIRVQDCPDAIVRALPALINLEIDVLLRERGPSRSPPDHVAVRCSDDRVFLEVTLGATRRASSLELGELLPEHRARAVALATAELVHAMSPREPSSPAPTPKTAAPKPPPTSQPPDDRNFTPEPGQHRERSGPLLAAGVLALWLGEPKAMLFGARLSFDHSVASDLVASFSLDGALGDSSTASAPVRLETLTAGAHLYLEARTPRVGFQAGPGLRFGGVRLTGRPKPESAFEGESLSALWGGPEIRARVATLPATPWAPAFALDLGAGYVALPVRGLVDGSASVFALEGVWLSACAQVGLSL